MQRRVFPIGLIALAMVAVSWQMLRPKGLIESPKSPCQVNLKQVALAFKQYINDFDEHYPLVFATNGSPDGVPPNGWADALQPYIRSTKVYQCPSDTAGGADDPRKANYTDYWYNANFVVREKGKPIGAKDADLGSESQIVISGDGGSTSGAPTGDATYNQCGDGTALTARTQTCTPSYPRIATFPAAMLHLNGANYAFADGHVKWLRGNNPTRSALVLNNGLTRESIAEKENSGKATFSLLSK